MKKLYIFDDYQASSYSGLCVHWRKRDIPEGHYSAADLADACLLDTRSEFLEWLYDMSTSLVGDTSILEHLCLKDGFSAWWLSNLVERHPWFYSKKLFEIFKLRALELFIRDHAITCIELYSNDACLARAVREISFFNKIIFIEPPVCRRSAFFTVCFSVLKKAKVWWKQSYICIIYLVMHEIWVWLFHTRRFFPLHPRLQRKHGIVVGTWFPHHDAAEAEKGRFVSAYIPALMPYIEGIATDVHWFFVQSKGDAKHAVQEREKLTGLYPDMTFWEECVNFYDVICVFFEAIHAIKVFTRILCVADSLFKMDNSAFNMSPFFDNLLNESALSNALVVRLLMRKGIKYYFEKIGPQRQLLTTSELQFWERLLFTEARSRGIPSLAIQNSVVVETDFRSCVSPRMAELSEFSVQMPDYFACNGSAPLKVMLKGGYPKAKLIMAETLRYQFLRDLPRYTGDIPTRLVVLTGYDAGEMLDQLTMLHGAICIGAGAPYAEINIKGHPLQPVEAVVQSLNLSSYGIQIVQTSVSELLQRPAVYFVSNSTAVSIEVMYAGYPLIIQGMRDDFNLSPLSGYHGVKFAYTSAALAHFLSAPPIIPICEDFFYFGKDLSKLKEKIIV